MLEKFDIAGKHIHPVAVEFFDVYVEDPRGQFVINGKVVVMGFLDELGNKFADILVPGFRSQRLIHRHSCLFSPCLSSQYIGQA